MTEITQFRYFCNKFLQLIIIIGMVFYLNIYISNESRNINSYYYDPFLKRKSNKEKALKCLDNCNFNNLKKLEDEKGFAEAITRKGSDEKIKFFNLGKDNDYRKLLNENLINKMNNLFQEELVKYKYE